MTLVILAVLAISLFTLAYLTRRRFGVLGLGLTAGVLLARDVSGDVENFLKYADMPVDPLSFGTAALVLLVLTPALLLLFSGPKYGGPKMALLGSLAFAVFGTVLLLAPLSRDLPLQDASIQPVMTFVAQNSSLIVAACVVLAVLDALNMQKTKHFGKKSKH